MAAVGVHRKRWALPDLEDNHPEMWPCYQGRETSSEEHGEDTPKKNGASVGRRATWTWEGKRRRRKLRGAQRKRKWPGRRETRMRLAMGSHQVVGIRGIHHRDKGGRNDLLKTSHVYSMESGRESGRRATISQTNAESTRKVGNRKTKRVVIFYY